MHSRILTATITSVFLTAGALVARAEDKPKTDGAAPAVPNSNAGTSEVQVGRATSSATLAPGAVAGPGVSGSIQIAPDGVSKGKATVTIEVNGKKEVRQIDIGNATEIKVGVDNAKATPLPFLGIASVELSDELAAQLPLDPGTGLAVVSVTPKSPAAAVGLERNDVLVKLDDQPLTSPRQLQKLITAHKVGDTVRVVYFRKGQRAEIEAKLGEHPGGEAAAAGVFNLGSMGGNPGNPLVIHRRAVLVDKDGKVHELTQPDSEHEVAIKRLADDLTQARRNALAAAQQLYKAGNAATELDKKQAEETRDQVNKALRALREELSKPENKEVEGAKPQGETPKGDAPQK
jgi:membrane-associated protease RseP (regulator of RpoE activity)